MADLPTELRTLVQRYGSHVLDDPDGLRATLDDFLDEDANPGDVNLLVDAVRFGALDRLKTLLDQGAEPSAAMVDVAEALAQRRGGDAESAYWACAVLGYAADLLPADLVPGKGQAHMTALPGEIQAVAAVSHHSGAAHTNQVEAASRVGGTPDSDEDASKKRRFWQVATVVAVIALLAATDIYLLVTRNSTDSSAERTNEVPLSELSDDEPFGHFGSNLPSAMQACSDGTIPGGELDWNCQFRDPFGNFDLELTEQDPSIIDSHEQLPEKIDSPPPGTIVTQQPDSPVWHAYYMRREYGGTGASPSDDQVSLILYDVDPEHAGAAIFTSRDSKEAPLTRRTADRLLQTIGAKADKFPPPKPFETLSLKAFAPQSLVKNSGKCDRDFTKFNHEREHVLCTDGSLNVELGYINGDLQHVEHRYRKAEARTYEWDGTRSEHGVLWFLGPSTLIWEKDGSTTSFGVLTGNSDHQGLIDSFESLQRATVPAA